MISVIIPCYNYGHLLKETLESLLKQTEPGWEAIIIDSASSDETAQVAKAYCEKDRRFNYLYNERGGVSRSRNLGMKHSKGEFLQFLDADDLLQPHKFQSDLEQLQKHPGADAVYSMPLFFSHPDQRHTYFNYKLTQEPPHPYMIDTASDRNAITSKILTGNIFAINSLCLRKKSFTNLQFNESIGQNEDWLFWCMAVLSGLKFQYYESGDAKALIRVHRSSVSQNESNMLIGGMIVTQLLEEIVTKKEHKKILKRKLLGQRHRFLSLLKLDPASFFADELKRADLQKALTPRVGDKITQFTNEGKINALRTFLKFELFKLRIALKFI